MHARRFSSVLALAALAACGGAPAPEGNAHLILISIDTLRADHLACYGHPFVQSPAIDALAGEGVLFTTCMSTAPTTLSSHTSLLTGLYPHKHGVARNGYRVNEDNLMLPEILGERGYMTAAFVGAAPLHPDVGFDQGFVHFDHEFSVGEDVDGLKVQRPADEVTAATLDWIDARGGVEEKERLFLFVHYYDVHGPYVAPPPYEGMYREDDLEHIDGSNEVVKEVRTAISRATRRGARKAGESAEEGFRARLQAARAEVRAMADAVRREYAAGVTWTDSQVGVLLDGLRERGILDEAVVVLTSDHGETLDEHMHTFRHGLTVFDSEIHVPLILRLPGARHGGRRIERLTSGVDVLPTVLSLLDLPIPPGIHGEDVSPALVGEMPPRDAVYAEATKPHSEGRFNDDPLWPNRAKFQCVRTHRHKYMARIPDEQYRLYELGSDPDEERNLLSEGAEDGDVLGELRAAFEAWRASADPRPSEMVDSDLQSGALRELGYAEDGEEEGDGEEGDEDAGGGPGGG